MFHQMTIVGNVGNIKDLKYMPDGTAVFSFSVAVNIRTGKGDNRKEVTVWYDCDFWGERAENMKPHIVKGLRVFVQGDPKLRAYVDKNGEAQAACSIRIDKFLFLTPKAESEGAGEKSEPAEQTEMPF